MFQFSGVTVDGMDTLGERIKMARRRKGYSSADALAEVLRVSPRTVRNWEKGRTSPRNALPELERILGPLIDDAPDPADDWAMSPSEVARRVLAAEEAREAAIARGDLDPDEEFIRQSKTLTPRDKEVLLATLRALRGDGPAERQHETG